MTSGFYRFLGALENFPVLDTMTKEVVGINTPKIVVTRSDTERMDVAVNEIGNTAAFGAGGALADQVFKKVFETAQQAPLEATAHRWAVIGRSLGIYSVIFSMMWAMPFIRNYITASHTGRVKFTDVIEPDYPNKPGQPQNRQNALQEALAYYRKQALTILGLGAAGAITSVGLARLAASSARKPGEKTLDWLFNHRIGKNLLLEGGKFSKFGGWPALLFWGVPAYGGWLHASRDPYEKKEQALKFANFVACFFGPSVLMNRWFQGKFQQEFPATQLKNWSYEAINKTFSDNPSARDKALSLWKQKNLLSLGSSIVLLGTMPQLINIYLTKQRLQRDKKAKQAAIHPNGNRVPSPTFSAPPNFSALSAQPYGFNATNPAYIQPTRPATPIYASGGVRSGYSSPTQFRQPLVF